jgi:molybdate transport system substrate-binding protein
MLSRIRTWLAPIAAMVGALTLSAAPALADPTPPVVLAAASLQESLGAAADAWAAKGHPRPVLSLAASSALARQIEAGAPADLFISADEEWMDHVAGKGLLRADSRVDLLTNSLVLIAPAAGTASNLGSLKIAPGFALADALGGGRLATGSVDSVPAGRYAKQALIALNVWPQVSDKIAGAESVRAALALVARAEAPLGIVYATDARAEPKVRVVGIFPESSHEPIRYPLALLAASTNPEAQGFASFLRSGAGKAIFARFGFGTR